MDWILCKRIKKLSSFKENMMNLKFSCFMISFLLVRTTVWHRKFSWTLQTLGKTFFVPKGPSNFFWLFLFLTTSQNIVPSQVKSDVMYSLLPGVFPLFTWYYFRRFLSDRTGHHSKSSHVWSDGFLVEWVCHLMRSWCACIIYLYFLKNMLFNLPVLPSALIICNCI